MINRIELNNFQAHQKSTLEFVNGLNVITGQSDQGKSSIIHALYWLFLNKPSGTEFVNWNSKQCSVKAFIGKQTIERYRGTTNSYIINGQQFDAVRSDVPQQVSEIIKISSTNIQLQDDPYFLLYSQSGEIAKQLNQVVGIDQIDSSLQYVNKIIRKQNTQFTFLEEELKSKKEELKKYDVIKSVEKAHKEFSLISDQIQGLSSKLIKLDKVISGLTAFDSLQDEEADLQKLEVKIQRFGIILQKYFAVDKTLSDVSAYISDIKATEQFVKATETAMKPLVNALKRFIDLSAQDDQNEEFKSILTYVRGINSLTQHIGELEIELNSLAEGFDELKKKLKICPLCDQPF